MAQEVLAALVLLIQSLTLQAAVEAAVTAAEQMVETAPLAWVELGGIILAAQAAELVLLAQDLQMESKA